MSITKQQIPGRSLTVSASLVKRKKIKKRMQKASRKANRREK